MQIDADPQEDQQNAPDTNYIVENPTLVSSSKTFIYDFNLMVFLCTVFVFNASSTAIHPPLLLLQKSPIVITVHSISVGPGAVCNQLQWINAH